MLRFSVVLGVLGLTGLALFGCDDKKDGGSQSGASQIGESCQSTADCAASLACFSGSCRLADSNVTPNGKQCKSIQCETTEDCCSKVWQRGTSCTTYETMCAASPTSTYCAQAAGPDCVCKESNYACTNNLCARVDCNTPADCCAAHWTRSSTCTTAETMCAQDPTTYASYCTTAQSSSCVCNDTTFTYGCTANTCVYQPSCTTNSSCSSTAPICSGGHCVECAADTDCTATGEKCVKNICVAPQCRTNSECPVFSQCQDDNTCLKVGCATDRECMTYLNSYLATCNKSAKPVPTCEVSCERDSQCATTANPLRICSSGRCMDPGCETDEECKLQLRGSTTTTTTATRGLEYVCRTIATK